MSDIHELLDDAKKKSEALVNEIEAFKKSRLLHESATESLESMNKVLYETAEAIKPFTEARVKRLTIIVLAMGALNTILFLIILILAIN